MHNGLHKTMERQGMSGNMKLEDELCMGKWYKKNTRNVGEV